MWRILNCAWKMKLRLNFMVDLYCVAQLWEIRVRLITDNVEVF